MILYVTFLIPKAFYCLTCKEGRVTELCLCQDGYFEAKQIHCLQCENKCLTCSNTSANCLQYKRDRVNISNCICVGAQYDDLEKEYCQQCLDFVELVICETALSCMGNRMLTTDTSDDEPLHPKCHFATPWCSSILLYDILTCEVTILQARLSDDFLSIQLSFDFPLTKCILCHNFMRIFVLKSSVNKLLYNQEKSFMLFTSK